MLSNYKIENLEYKYLKKIHSILNGNIDNMIKNLHSMNKIKLFWYDKNDAGYDAGAERIIYSILQRASDLGEPNSSPIAADLFFENLDSFIHIDLKTNNIESNAGDHWGIKISHNQSSYSIKYKVRNKDREFIAQLPNYYNDKPTLTFFITILYSMNENHIFKIININVSSMPNGQLASHYNDKPIRPGGNITTKDIRFNMMECNEFELLTPKKKRILKVYMMPEIEEFLKNVKYHNGDNKNTSLKKFFTKVGSV